MYILGKRQLQLREIAHPVSSERTDSGSSEPWSGSGSPPNQEVDSASHEPLKGPLVQKRSAALGLPGIWTGHLSSSLERAAGTSQSRDLALLSAPITSTLIRTFNTTEEWGGIPDRPRQAPPGQNCYQQLHTCQPRYTKSLCHSCFAPP